MVSIEAATENYPPPEPARSAQELRHTADLVVVCDRSAVGLKVFDDIGERLALSRDAMHDFRARNPVTFLSFAQDGLDHFSLFSGTHLGTNSEIGIVGMSL